MKKLILITLIGVALAGCSSMSKYSLPQGDALRNSPDRHIKSIMDGTYASYGSDEDLTFSNIYSIKTIGPRSALSWQVCSLFRGSDWEPGEYKQAHLKNGVTTIANSNVLTGVCDPSRYPSRPSNFAMKSGLTLEQIEQLSKTPTPEKVSEDSEQHLRERVEPSENDIEHAQNVIKEKLKDPESARFRRVYGAQGEVEKIAICGEVNAKNSYGGYTGYKPFMVFEDGDRGFVWDSNEDGFSFDNMMIEETCPTES